jgi:hypothetical protein
MSWLLDMSNLHIAKNPTIVKAASNYARDAVITTEVLQRIPWILHL